MLNNYLSLSRNILVCLPLKRKLTHKFHIIKRNFHLWNCSLESLSCAGFYFLIALWLFTLTASTASIFLPKIPLGYLSCRNVSFSTIYSGSKKWSNKSYILTNLIIAKQQHALIKFLKLLIFHQLFLKSFKYSLFTAT